MPFLLLVFGKRRHERPAEILVDSDRTTSPLIGETCLADAATTLVCHKGLTTCAASNLGRETKLKEAKLIGV